MSVLKDLSIKADVPYPLFFSSLEKVKKQIDDKEKNLLNKFPTKKEIQVSSRGSMQKEDIELIIKDIGRKQEFLKNRVLTVTFVNNYIGSLAKISKSGSSTVEIAEYVRNFFDIDLRYMRSLSKKKILQYLCKKIEDKGIFVSLSSHNFMPQRIDPTLGLSGVCIKDKKFPFIFVNTRDGDEKPLILETYGRQIFTVVSMLVCIGMNLFVLSIKDGRAKKGPYHFVNMITAEILIPASDLVGFSVKSIDELKDGANLFKVTPSMFLRRLYELNGISKHLFDAFSAILKSEIESASPPGGPTLPVNGYGKYNGERFSREIVGAYQSGRISREDAKGILFRKKRVDSQLFNDYSEKYK